MELTDLMDKEDWMAFEKELNERFNLNCAVFNSSGVGLTGKPNWCNALCPKIKGNKESLAVICAAGNQNFMAQAEKTKKPVIGECDAGLVKIAVPIEVDGKFMGTAGGCGRLPKDGDPETFMIQKTTGMNEDEVSDLCQSLEPMTEDQVKDVTEFIEQRIEKVIDDYKKR